MATFRLPSVTYAPPKYQRVLDALADGPLTAREVGATFGWDGRPGSRLTQLAHGRLRALEASGHVQRITTELHGDQEHRLPEIVWRLTGVAS